MVGSLVWEGEVGEAMAASLIGEVAHFEGYEGLRGADATWITLGSGLGVGRWNTALSHTWRGVDGPGGRRDDHVVQVTGGYALADGVALDIGYRYLREDRLSSHTLGVVLAIFTEFGTLGMD